MKHGTIVIFYYVIYIASTIQQPCTEFEKLEHDFGIVRPYEVHKIRVHFRNKGKGVLRIEKIESYCGCVNSFVIINAIQLGGEGFLEIHFNSEDNSGEVIKHIYVHTNDPRNEIVDIKLKAYVKK